LAFARDLLRGSIDLLVLSDLSSGERYGYQILTSLREISNGRIDLKAGTLYPILHKLERAGMVASRWDDTSGRDRKWYALTQRGRARLRDDTREWLDYTACVRGVLAPVLEALAPPAAPAPGAPHA
jgi:DNA-binding PadR family transcriptional regulator